ncbi:MAG: DUF1214 domain-containing protein [Rhodomicrobium sp.]|nr:DUF1214 domain-containing protein [Rhodomicrobium sp.]
MPFLTRFFIFAAIALTLGLGSAWRAVNHRFFATSNRFGPWVFWFREGTSDADPYTVAHIARQGGLPITAASAMTFTATRDSAGSRLSGDRTYEIRGAGVPALWWSLGAFKPDGEIMPSKTGRSSFTSANILAAPGGTFTVRLSPDVQPGNWLPATRGNRVVLRLSILRPLSPDSLLKSGADILPEITLVECS